MRVPHRRVEYEGFVIKGHTKVIDTYEEFKRCCQSLDDISPDLLESTEKEEKEEKKDYREE